MENKAKISRIIKFVTPVIALGVMAYALAVDFKPIYPIGCSIFIFVAYLVATILEPKGASFKGKAKRAGSFLHIAFSGIVLMFILFMYFLYLRQEGMW